MIEHVEVIHLLDHPAARRLWLLEQALRSVPLEAAVELARTAEAFIMGSAGETVTDDPTAVIRRDQEPSEPTVQPVSAGSADREAAHTGFPLTEDQRDRLLERLAEGARNAELVAEFRIPLSKSRGSAWVATGRLPIGAQGLLRNLLDPQPSINPQPRPLRSTRSFVTCGNRTMLSSRRKMAGIW